jgi:hypothetical protein
MIFLESSRHLDIVVFSLYDYSGIIQVYHECYRMLVYFVYLFDKTLYTIANIFF